MPDHDRLFKELLTTFFVEFLELFLPELAAQLDRPSVVFLDKEVFTDVTGGQRHEVDLLVQARLRGENSCFLVHVENQAQVQPRFAKRMFRYFARIHEKHDLPIYPIALFSHESQRPEPDCASGNIHQLPALCLRSRLGLLRRALRPTQMMSIPPTDSDKSQVPRINIGRLPAAGSNWMSYGGCGNRTR